MRAEKTFPLLLVDDVGLPLYYEGASSAVRSASGGSGGAHPLNTTTSHVAVVYLPRASLNENLKRIGTGRVPSLSGKVLSHPAQILIDTSAGNWPGRRVVVEKRRKKKT